MIIEKSIPQTRQELFITLYKNVFPTVAIFIQKMGGNLEDAKDIFQDGLLIFYEKTLGHSSVVKFDDKAYLVGICKHLWYKKYQTGKRMKEFDQLPELIPAIDQEPLAYDLLRMMEQSGKKCLELLQAFYFDKCNMKEIAKIFGFSGIRSATA